MNRHAEPITATDVPAGAGSVVITDVAPTEVVSRLDQLARRGKLPGFIDRGGGRFSVEAYGQPFDHELDAAATREGERTVIRFQLRRLRKTPLIYWLIVLLTIWPGVWLTDSMLHAYFSGYHIATWMWYLPVTILPLPWMWLRAVRRSHAMAQVSAGEAVKKIAAEAAGRVEGA